MILITDGDYKTIKVTSLFGNRLCVKKGISINRVTFEW